MPFGTAHETATPSRSRRRSQCRRVALCSWTTKRPAASPAPPPAGSGVPSKSRFPRYSPSLSGVRGLFLVGFSVRGSVRRFFALFRAATQRLVVLCVPCVIDQLFFGE